MAKAADAEPVPERPELHERSLALMSLQLLKRWRNKRYDQRDGRWPPSILFACLVGEHAAATRRCGIVRHSLQDELAAHAGAILTLFEAHGKAGALVHRANPRCPADVITDRWPGSMSDQTLFLRDLRDLNMKLLRLGVDTGLDEKRVILADLFGERVTRLAFDEYQDRLDESARTSGVLYAPRTGAIQSGLPAVLVVPGRAPGIVAPRHTFFGGARVGRPWRS